MKFIVKKTDNREKGVFASKNIKKGEEVLSFRGNKIVKKRDHHTLQIGLRKHFIVLPPEKYVNHSCCPTCGIKNNKTLIAIKQIKKGEEITFDYAMTESKLSGMKCLCGNKKCRGKIFGFLQLNEKEKNKYKKYCSDYLKQYVKG